MRSVEHAWRELIVSRSGWIGPMGPWSVNVSADRYENPRQRLARLVLDRDLHRPRMLLLIVRGGATARARPAMARRF